MYGHGALCTLIRSQYCFRLFGVYIFQFKLNLTIAADAHGTLQIHSQITEYAFALGLGLRFGTAAGHGVITG